MDYNVLVLAMSLLPAAATNPNAKESIYRLKKDGRLVGKEYRGVGQLEAIPLFIEDTFNVRITHIIMLVTPETQDAVDFDGDPTETFRKLCELHGDKLDLECEVAHPLSVDENAVDFKAISHVEFFERRMAHEGLYPEFETISLDIENPEEGFSELQDEVRRLYGLSKATHGSWNLWIDTHGGFREISMAMFGLMQMLAAPDEQDFARYLSGDKALSESIKHIGDGNENVPIKGVYSIEFDLVKARRGEVQPIWDRTDFYSNFTKPAIQAYMNYGQYAQMFLKSTANDGPYAFISYKHGESTLERYALLGSMKQHGYRYWYDDAIELQHDWDETLREAVDGCSAFIAVVTKGYSGSFVCLQELRRALDSGKLVVLVSPDKTDLYANGGDWEKYKNDENGKVIGHVVVKREELAEIVRKQQLAFSGHILNDVFQEPAVADRLEGLCAYDPRFARIREEFVEPACESSVPNSALTHAGVFHADDVFGGALLRILNPGISIRREYAVPEGYDGLVFDVGGGEFDHHGTERKERDDGTPYAAFGLLWRRFGQELLCAEDADTLDKDLVRAIDVADNGGEPCELSLLVSDFNPRPPSEPSDYDRAYHVAVKWAQDILDRRIGVLRDRRADVGYVRERMAACDGRVLVLERYASWRASAVGSSYIYVVYPSQRGGFNVQGVPLNMDTRDLVRPFPVEWRGTPAEVLRELTGVEDFGFCHASGFLCAVGSLDGAMRVAELALA